jgi:hypothetical protein
MVAVVFSLSVNQTCTTQGNFVLQVVGDSLRHGLVGCTNLLAAVAMLIVVENNVTG